MITTIHGLMDEGTLDKKEFSNTTPDGLVEAVEYWLGSELVHRSVHLTLNKGIESFGEAHNLG